MNVEFDIQNIEILSCFRPANGASTQPAKKSKSTTGQRGAAAPSPPPRPTGAEKHPENWDLLEGIWPFEDRPEGKEKFLEISRNVQNIE